jgi:hypothetical protein
MQGAVVHVLFFQKIALLIHKFIHPQHQAKFIVDPLKAVFVSLSK